MIIYTKYIFRCEVKTTFYPSHFMGNSLRGGFGCMFRRLSCHSHINNCDQCLLKTSCPYSQIFESPSPENSLIMKKANYIPHPFTFSLEINPGQLEAGEKFNIIVTIFGDYIRYLPYFILSVQRLGDSGLARKSNKFDLLYVKVQEIGDERIIYSKGDAIIKDYGIPWQWNITNNSKIQLADSKENYQYSDKNSIDKITLNFTSPLRLKNMGRIFQDADIPFSILFNNIVRRLLILSNFYCQDGTMIKLDVLQKKSKKVEILSSTLRWIEIYRFSNKQNRQLQMGGLIGKISYTGNLSNFIGYLKIGQDIQIGNGTVFGLGKYILDK